MTPDEMNAALAQMLRDKGWQPVWAHNADGNVYVLKDTTGSVPFGQEGEQFPGAILAFRPPQSVKVFDVDDYEEKHGMGTIDRACAVLGPLPPTWRVSARGPGNPSGRYLYRCPEDVEFNDAVFQPYGVLEVRNGKSKVFTDVEVVRTRHRFSWAPGTEHYKNGALIEVFDEFDVSSAMPAVDELPMLPAAWIDYLRNPPRPQSDMQFRPDPNAFGDGSPWWLEVPSDSLSSRGQLCDFAFWMLIDTGNDTAEVIGQLQRVSTDLDPSDPWLERDFHGMTDANTQNKTAEYMQRRDANDAIWPEATAAIVANPQPAPAPSPVEEPPATVVVTESVVIQPASALDSLFDNYTAPPAAPPAEQVPVVAEPTVPIVPAPAYYAKMPDVYKQEITRQWFNRQAKLDIEAGVRLQQGDEWKARNDGHGGFSDPYDAEDPPDPTTFRVVGAPTPLVTPNTVTILYGNRASGKTWVAATWAKQEVVEGNHVMWLDFERQASLMKTKLHALNVPRHLSKTHFHYSGGGLPPVDYLAELIQDYLLGSERVLVVIDSFRDLLGAVVPAGDSNSGESIGKVYSDYLNYLHAAGGTIALIDHAPKSNTDSAFGSERKESAADNIFKVEMKEKFVLNHSGYSIITCTKDRYGVVPVDAAGEPAPAYLWVPGDDDVPKGKGAKQYPACPELRTWSPEPEVGLDDWDKPVSVTDAESADIRSFFSEGTVFGTATEVAQYLVGLDAARKKWVKRNGKPPKWEPGMKVWAGRQDKTKFAPHKAADIAHNFAPKAAKAGLVKDANGNWSWPDALKPAPSAATGQQQDVLALLNSGED